MKGECDLSSRLVEIRWEPPEDKMIANDKSLQKRILRVAAYCRVSSFVDQQMDSLEIQKRHFMKLIQDNQEWVLVGIYMDNGITGTDRTKRMGFQRMIRHCEEGKIDRILSKSISRFGRNTAEVLEVIYNLKEKNIGIYFEKENIDTLSQTSEFVLSTIAAIAQEESRSISENTSWAIKKKYLQGEPNLNRILGYDISIISGKREMIINEEEATIVREVFELAAEGIKHTQIALIMRQKGYKTFRGLSEWSHSNIRSILTNEKYTGDVMCQKTYTPDYLSHDRIMNDGEREKYLIENHHQPIISHELFKKVQDLKAVSKQRFKKEQIDYKKHLFSRRLLCGECGSNYNLSRRSKDSTWRCSRNIKYIDACVSEAVHESQLQEVMRKAFKIRYGEKSMSFLHNFKMDIIKIHENDNFELQRLSLNNKYSAALKLEMRSHGDEHEISKAKLKEIEEIIKRKEIHWKFIEEDREIRISTLDRLDKSPRISKNSDMIVSDLSIEQMRALITNIVISSSGDYLVKWADNIETEIIQNSSSEEKQKFKYTARETNNRKVKSQDTSNMTARETKSNNKNFTGNLDFRPTSWSFPAIMSGSVGSDESHKKRICAYCRVSSKYNKQFSSFKLQITHYTSLILSNESWSFSGIYADEGASGLSIKRRKNFLRMIEDCKEGKIDFVIVKSISRFARNTVDCLNYVQMLKSLPSPVGVYFEKENINTLDDKNNMLMTILGALAQEESRSTSAVVRWGFEKRFENGIVNIPIANLLGYDRDELGNWIVNKKEAETVKRIYSEYLKGKNSHQIAKELTQDAVKTKYGLTTWRYGGVRSILKNEKYCGDVLLQKYVKNNFMDQKIVPNRGEQPKYLVVDHHEAIITRDEWDAVQVEIERERQLNTGKLIEAPDNENRSEIFKGKIFCGECGSLFLSKIQTSKGAGEKYRYWIWKCKAFSGYIPGEQCNVGSFRDEEIENAFMYMLLEFTNNKNELISNVKGAIERMEFTELEAVRCEKLKDDIKTLYQRVSEVGLLNEKVREAEATNESIVQFLRENEILQSELEEFNKRDKERLHIIRELNWILNELNALKDTDPALSYIQFRDDIFSRIVRRCTAFENGIIEFDLMLGISRKMEIERTAGWIRKNNNGIKYRYRKKKESIDEIGIKE
jgi:DNA invertase Pin-like site-specific DNA recombinase